MGHPSDVKSPSGLPVYALLPTEEYDDAAPRVETRRERRRRRFRLFGMHALILSTALFFLFQGGKLIKGLFRYKYSIKDFLAEQDVFGDEAYRPYPTKCVKWSNDSDVEDSTFKHSFPIDTPSFFVSRGPLVGTVNYLIADESASKDFINVTMTLSGTDSFVGDHTPKESFLRKVLPAWVPRKQIKVKKPRAEICYLKDHYSKEPSGFAVLVPHRRPRGGWGFWRRRSCHGHNEPHGHHEHRHGGHHHHGRRFGKRFPIVHAQITITIPPGVSYIPALHSVFPAMDHNIGNVFDEIEFGNLSVAGKSIGINTITSGRAALIASSDQPINGTFTVHDKLSIVAKNAPITADVTLFSSPDADKPTVLDIVNDHGTITTTVALLLNSTSEPDYTFGSNGSFAISAVTSEAEILANVTAQPIESTLKFSAVSKHANVAVSLPPAFEGRLSLVASRPGGSAVELDKETPDPTGAGRTRYLDIKTIFGSIVTGSVGWRDDATDPFIPLEHAVVPEEWEEDLDEQEGESLVGGWEVLEAIAMEAQHDPAAIKKHFVDHDLEHERGSSVSLVTSAATNYLYFA